MTITLFYCDRADFFQAWSACVRGIYPAYTAARRDPILALDAYDVNESKRIDIV